MFGPDVVPEPVGELEGLVADLALVGVLLPLVLGGQVNSQKVVLVKRLAALGTLVAHRVLVVRPES